MPPNPSPTTLMQHALAQAEQAASQAEIPVGAIVVAPDGHTILGRGHNRCIACGLCQAACPNGTIHITTEMVTDPETGKSRRRPILLFGKDFWTRLVNFDLLIETGMISPGDEKLFHFVESAEQAWALLESEYDMNKPAP